MMKKFKFINLMPPALAVVATIAILIACGKGMIENIDDDPMEIEDAIEYMEKNPHVDSIKQGLIKSSSSTKSSSSIGKSSSSEAGSASGTSSSSGDSSNSGQSSSSGKAQSSSSESPYMVECTVVIDTATVGKAIPDANRPKVRCIKKSDASLVAVLDPKEDVRWLNAPVWPAPQLGNYADIKVEIYDDAEVCQELTATCTGVFRVCPANGCPSTASSSSAAPSSSSSLTPGSSGATPSSSSLAPSSSSMASSSSVAPPPTLTCTLPATLTPGATISAATQRSYLKCSNTNAAPTAGTPTWIGSPRAPISGTTVAAAGSYNEIYVTADCGTTTGITAQCNNVTIAYSPTCSISGIYNTGVGIAVPTYSCGTGVTSSGAQFSATAGSPNGGTVFAFGPNKSCSPSPCNTGLNWNNTTPASQSFGVAATGREIRMYEVTCGGGKISYAAGTEPVPGEGILCGSITIGASSSSVASSSSAAQRTINCTFAKNSYTTVESVPAPTITCVPDGSVSMTNAVFTATGVSPLDIAAWKSSNPTSYSSAGTSTVKVSGVACGSQNPPEATCTPALTITAAPSSSSSASATYTVTYSANSGIGAPAAQTKTQGVPLTLSSTKPTRDGYTFASWNTAANGGGTSYASGGSYTADANVTLYAQWTAAPTCTAITTTQANIQMSVGTCYTYEAKSNCGFRAANYNTGTIKISIIGGGCNESSYSLTSNNSTAACTRTTGTTTITGVEGSSGNNNIQVDCY